MKLNRPTLIGIIVLLILVVFVLASALAPRTDAQIEAIRKAGHPATLAELDDWYPRVPESQNAAVVYTEAFAKMKPNLPPGGSGSLIGEIPLPSRRESLPADARAELSELLASNQTVLATFHSADTLTRCRYPLDFNDGFTTLLPHLSQVKEAVRLLTAQAVLDANDRKPAQAAEALLTAGRVADSLRDEPCLISQLVRYANWAIVVARLEWVLNHASLDDAQLTALQTALEHADQSPAFERALAGERAMGLSIYTDRKTQNAYLNSTPPGGSPTMDTLKTTALFSLLKSTGILQRDKAFYLDVMATNIAAATKPYPERFTASQTAGALTGTRPSRLYIFSSMILPALGKAHNRDADYVARLRVAQTALAVERFRLAHANALPESLDELSPKFLKLSLTDPCDGAKLRFKKLERGFEVYCIGSDGRDDGGAEYNSKKPKDPHDITFIVER